MLNMYGLCNFSAQCFSAGSLWRNDFEVSATPQALGLRDEHGYKFDMPGRGHLGTVAWSSSRMKLQTRESKEYHQHRHRARAGMS